MATPAEFTPVEDAVFLAVALEKLETAGALLASSTSPPNLEDVIESLWAASDSVRLLTEVVNQRQAMGVSTTPLQPRSATPPEAEANPKKGKAPHTIARSLERTEEHVR